MGNLIQAAEDIRRLAVRFKSIMEVADALEVIGSIEQAGREALIRKDQAIALEQDAVKSLQNVKLQIENEKLKLEAIRKNADDTIRDATNSAATIFEKTKQKAEDIIKSANAEFNKIMDQKQVLIADIAVLDDKKKAAQVSLDELNENIAKVKSQLASFMGK